MLIHCLNIEFINAMKAIYRLIKCLNLCLHNIHLITKREKKQQLTRKNNSCDEFKVVPVDLAIECTTNFLALNKINPLIFLRKVKGFKNGKD